VAAVVARTATLVVLAEVVVVATGTTVVLAHLERLARLILAVVAVLTETQAAADLSSLTLDKSQHLRLVHQLCQAQNILLLLVERLLSDV
jgi:hypothetical protein